MKTTQFGAFVELKKGTDGLLHVSNVGPGRVGHIEDVIARGDVLDVIVQEVDKERGRIGLKLVAKHENGRLVQPEELIERAKDAPPREPEEERRAATPRRRGRRPRPRPAPRLARSERSPAAGDGRRARLVEAWLDGVRVEVGVQQALAVRVGDRLGAAVDAELREHAAGCASRPSSS